LITDFGRKLKDRHAVYHIKHINKMNIRAYFSILMSFKVLMVSNATGEGRDLADEPVDDGDIEDFPAFFSLSGIITRSAIIHTCVFC